MSADDVFMGEDEEGPYNESESEAASYERWLKYLEEPEENELLIKDVLDKPLVVNLAAEDEKKAIDEERSRRPITLSPERPRRVRLKGYSYKVPDWKEVSQPTDMELMVAKILASPPGRNEKAEEEVKSFGTPEHRQAIEEFLRARGLLGVPSMYSGNGSVKKAHLQGVASQGSSPGSTCSRSRTSKEAGPRDRI